MANDKIRIKLKAYDYGLLDRSTSEIIETAELPGRADVGALRIVTRATRDLPCAEFPVEDGAPDKPGVILELDYWALMVR